MNATNNGNGVGHSNGNGATKQPIHIETRLPHASPHIDEVCADMLLVSFGEKLFPGIRTAVLKFSENPPNLTDAEWDALKTIPYGCGGNVRFNEHGKGGKERQEGTCCTTLVADYLGIRNDRVIKPIIDAVLRFDSTDKTWPTELPELMKVAYRNMPTSQEFVVDWAQKALRAIHEQLLVAYGPSCRLTLMDIFEKNAEKYSNPDVLNWIKQMLNRSQTVSRNQNEHSSLMELAYIVDCMNRVGKMSTVEIEKWVMFILDCMYRDQIDFRFAVDQINKTGFKFPIPVMINGRVMTVPAVLVRTESKQAVKAAHHRSTGRSKVIIVRNNAGNVQIFTDPTVGLNLTNLVGMLRWLELPKNQNGKPAKHVNWSVLCKEGDFEGSKFYFFKMAGQVLNGSHSHPGVPASEISTQSILECVQHAFHPKEFAFWRADRGISREDVGLPALSPRQPCSNYQPPNAKKIIPILPLADPETEQIVSVSFEKANKSIAPQNSQPASDQTSGAAEAS